MPVTGADWRGNKMYKLGSNGTKVLKTLHLIAASCWVGGSLTLGLIYFLKQGLDIPEAVYGINLTMHHIDVLIVIIPGAMGCLLTGLIYSIFTNWGFFRHHWITVKWVITVTAILFGTFYLGPWIQDMIRMSSAGDVSANQEYLNVQKLHFIYGSIQAVSLLFAVYLSVYKPWKRKKL
jgi:uncharacterized membrane protein